MRDNDTEFKTAAVGIKGKPFYYLSHQWEVTLWCQTFRTREKVRVLQQSHEEKSTAQGRHLTTFL